MAGARKLPALSDAQWEIMNIIWDRSECSVAEVWQVLNARRKVSRNTVHTLIVRLEEKGWLLRCELVGRLSYRPTVSRENSQQATIERFVQTVFKGSSEGLVLALLNGGTLSKEEATRIRKLIDSASKRPKQ